MTAASVAKTISPASRAITGSGAINQANEVIGQQCVAASAESFFHKNLKRGSGN